MKKKLSKVLAVVLSLAMVLGLAAVDTTAVGQAAKKLKFTKTGKKDVKSGQKRTLKISGTKAKKAKWTVTGTGKQYIKLAKKKGKTNSFTVKANATGKAKITAKLTKKNKVSVTYTLSCDLEGIAFDVESAAANVTTGETKILKLVGTPANADVPPATYTVWMDAEKKTAVPETTKVTAAAVEGGVEFTASAEGTYYVVATAGDFETTAVVTVKNHVAVLKEVKQTKLTELVLTFDSDCSYMKDNADVKDAIKITNATGTRIDVKSIVPDEKDNTKATVTTIVSMADGKENTVEYNGTSVKFTASTGEVTKIELNVAQAPIKTTIPLKGIFKDVNGVEVKVVKYGDYTDEKFEITVEPTGEASEDAGNNSIRMESLTDTVKVNAVYRSGKINTTTNEPEEYRESFVITAVAEGSVSGAKEYTIWKATNDDRKYTDLNDADKNEHTIKVSNAGAYAKKELYVLVKDEYGYDKVDGSLTAAGYVLSSADDTILQVNGDELQGNRAGKTSVIVSDAEGVVRFTIPVEVLAAPQLKTFTVDKTTVVLSAGNKALPSQRDGSYWKPDRGSVKIYPVDQYGLPYGDVEIKVYNPESSSKNYRELYNTWDEHANWSNFWDDDYIDVGVSVNGKLDATQDYDAEKKITKALKAGKSHSNTFTIEVKDENYKDTVVNKTVYVQTKQPKYDNVRTVKLEVDSTIDTTLTSSYSKCGNNTGVAKNVKVALYDGSNVFVAYDYLAITKNAITITKNSKTYKAGDNNYVINDYSFANGPTLGALYLPTGEADGSIKTDTMDFLYRKIETATGYSLTVPTAAGVKAEDYINVVRKADATRYTIKVANIKRVSAGGVQDDFLDRDTTCVTLGAASTDVIAATIKVEDHQKVPTITQLEKTMSTSNLEDVLENAFKIACADTDSTNEVYDPKAYEKNNDTGDYVINTVEKGFVWNEKGVSFTKIKVFVPYPISTKTVKDSNGDKITVPDEYYYVENVISAPYAVKAD